MKGAESPYQHAFNLDLAVLTLKQRGQVRSWWQRPGPSSYKQFRGAARGQRGRTPCP